MQQLREATSLAWYWQRDPLLEYKHQAFEAFEKLLREISKNTISTLFKSKIEIAVQKPISWFWDKIQTNEDQIESRITDWHISEDIKEIKYKKAKEVLKNEESKEFANLFKKNISENEKLEKESWWITVLKADDDNFKSNFLNNKKIWRNEPCPCWSWKKFKKCCN